MAEIYPDEGLDYILSIIPASGAPAPGSLWLGLFTDFTASTVGTSGTTEATITEPTGGGYARVEITSGEWSGPTNIGADGAGRRYTASGQQFSASGSDYSANVNGFFIASASTGGSLIFMANFDDEQAVDVNDGDTLTVTPWMGFTA